MKQISEHNYSVTHGEEVSIAVTPIAFQTNLIAATLDGQPLQPSGGLAAEYRFTATKFAGDTHVSRFEASFPPGTPAQAAYEFRVMGSFGGGETFHLPMSESSHEVQLRFYVEEVIDVALEGDPPIIVQGVERGAPNDGASYSEEDLPIIIDGPGIRPREPWE